VKFIASHDLADNLSILRMWAVETPRTIFPRRRIGCLDPGCEASFLGLGGDPIADHTNLGRIAIRVKQGVVLPPMAGPVILKRN
jgi:imidazolonepropionase-like amidohydrolase